MICFLVEFGFESKVVLKVYVEGIYVLFVYVEMGVSVIILFGLDDVILDMVIILNCVDVLSMNGVVYEVGVIIY